MQQRMQRVQEQVLVQEHVPRVQEQVQWVQVQEQVQRVQEQVQRMQVQVPIVPDGPATTRRRNHQAP